MRADMGSGQVRDLVPPVVQEGFRLKRKPCRDGGISHLNTLTRRRPLHSQSAFLLDQTRKPPQTDHAAWGDSKWVKFGGKIIDAHGRSIFPLMR